MEKEKVGTSVTGFVFFSIQEESCFGFQPKLNDGITKFSKLTEFFGEFRPEDGRRKADGTGKLRLARGRRAFKLEE
jgi:hypothetical protein